MAKRIFEVDVPDGQHLGDSHREEGAFDPGLYDDDNKLVDKAVLHDVTDEYTEYDDFECDDSYTYEADKKNTQPSEEDLEAIAALMVALVVIAPMVYEAVAPHVKTFFNKTIAPRLQSLKSAVGNRLSNIASRFKRTDQSEKKTKAEALIVELSDSGQKAALPPASTVYEISEEEAQRALIKCFVAYLALHDHIELLRNARITSANSASGYIEGKDLIALFETQDGIDKLNAALKANRDLLLQHADTISSALEHSITINDEFQPIEAKWLKRDTTPSKGSH